jgi:hypothetical protein
LATGSTTFEYPLYTDAHIVAEVEHGPYSFLNAIPLAQGTVRAAVILRFDWHWEFPSLDWSKTDAQRYHGGSPPDEVAALASLAMGVRLRAGDSMREFRPGGERKQKFLLLRCAGLFRRVDGSDPFRIDRRHSCCVKVSVHDSSIRVRRPSIG